MELKTVGEGLWLRRKNKQVMRWSTLTLKDVLHKMAKEEWEEILSSYYKWNDTSSKDDSQLDDSHITTQFDDLKDKDLNRILKFPFYQSRFWRVCRWFVWLVLSKQVEIDI